MSKSRLHKLEDQLRSRYNSEWGSFEYLMLNHHLGPVDTRPETYEALVTQAQQEPQAEEVQYLLSLANYHCLSLIEWQDQMTPMLNAYEAGSLAVWPGDLPTPPDEPEGLAEALKAFEPKTPRGTLWLMNCKALLALAQAVRRYQAGERAPEVLIFFDGQLVPDDEPLSGPRLLS